jgi:hypothetical protein
MGRGWPTVVITFVVLFSCTAVHHTRTVGKGAWAVETTFGGPMLTNLGAPLPVPNLFAGTRYGLREDLDIVGHINLLGPITPGLLDLSTGAHWVPVQPGLRTQADTPRRGWALGGAAEVQWVTDFSHGLVVLPALTVSGGYRVRWFNPFGGLSLGFNGYRPHESGTPLMVCPFVGVECILGDRVGLSAKCMLYDVAYNQYGSQIDWVYLVDDVDEGKRQAFLGVSLGFSYALGGRKR